MIEQDSSAGTQQTVQLFYLHIAAAHAAVSAAAAAACGNEVLRQDASLPSAAAAALQLHVFTRSHSIMHSLLSLASSAAAAAAGLDSSLCLQSLLLLQLHLLLLLHVNTEPVKVRL